MNSQEVDIIEEEENVERGKKRKPRRVSISIKDVPRPFYHIKDPMTREQFQAPLPSLIKNTTFDYVITPPPSGTVAPPSSLVSTAVPSLAGTAKKVAVKGGVSIKEVVESLKLKDVAQSSKHDELTGKIQFIESTITKFIQNLDRAIQGFNAKGKPFISEKTRDNAIRNISDSIDQKNIQLQSLRDELNQLETGGDDDDSVENVPFFE